MNQEIDSADCGANRHSRYDCPITCNFSPYHPDNYDQLLALETHLDSSIMDRARRHPFFAKQFERLFSQANPDEFIFAGKILEILHNAKNENGLNLFDDWKQDGYNSLKNDARVLLDYKRTMRISLIEIQEVVNEQTVTFVDLLEDTGRVHKAVDRSMASRACRFQTMLSYYYTVPAFTRFHASAWELPPLQVYSGLEAFKAVVNHLNIISRHAKHLSRPGGWRKQEPVLE